MSSEPADLSGKTVEEPRPDRWRILGVTLAVGFMALLDVTIVNVAIPSMQTGLRTDTATIQWVVSGYALAFGLTLVAGGRLGDVYGRRALMMVGLAGFILGSAASGLGSDARLVIAARVVQGMAAGLLTPQSSGLIQQLFRGKERGIAFGYFGTTVGVASAIGPILGGGLIAALVAWRFGLLIDGAGFASRLSAAEPGDLVRTDLQLRALAALVCGPFFAVLPVMIASAFLPEKPVRRGRAGEVRDRGLAEK